MSPAVQVEGHTILTQFDMTFLLITTIGHVILAHRSIIDKLGFPMLDPLFLPHLVQEVQIDYLEANYCQQSDEDAQNAA